jgi:maleylacetate reductase
MQSDIQDNPGFTVVPPGTHSFSQMERVRHGRPIALALEEELALLGKERVFLISNRSLANSEARREVVRVLGSRLVGGYEGVSAHSPRTCVLEAAEAARGAKADLVVALGGGSVIDAAKATLLCLRHGYSEVAQLGAHANQRQRDWGLAPADAAQWLRMVAIPTTLSAAEFASSAGLTDPTRGMKEAFMQPMMMPQSVIFDPAMTRSTPLALLLSTGMKAVDHAVERVTSASAGPFSDALSLLALRLLHRALPELTARPDDLQLRACLQYGAFMSVAGIASGTAVNVSHAIGHVLGGHAGVPHGHTTGVLLPAVLRWSLGSTAEAQQKLCDALGTEHASAADAIEALTRSLDLPCTLRELGLQRSDLPEIARKTMHESLLANSRKAVASPGDVEEILELAW